MFKYQLHYLRTPTSNPLPKLLENGRKHGLCHPSTVRSRKGGSVACVAASLAQGHLERFIPLVVISQLHKYLLNCSCTSELCCVIEKKVVTMLVCQEHCKSRWK